MKKNYIKMIALLLNLFVPLLHADEVKDFFEAAECNDVARMEELHRQGVSLCREYDGLFPLHVAAIAGSLDAINYLLDAGVSVDVVLPSEKTALHFAIEYHQNNVVTGLLQRGASAKKFSREAKEGLSPLMYAVKSGNTEAARILLSYRASILEKNRKGENAFALAAELGNRGLCELFREREETGDWLARYPSSGRLSPLAKKLIAVVCS